MYIFIEAILQLLHDENNKKRLKGERGVKKVISLTQIRLYTFSCNSVVLSWFLTKLWWYYNEQQREHIQERAYQCIWNNCMIFAQK